MCGIAGVYHLNGSTVASQQIDSLTDAVAHRGPDGRGVWFNSDVSLALGHRRLSILDTSENGHQPMSYDSGRYWITLNGEIFNFLEIKKELQAFGHAFQSQTDTEVILAAYKQWGTDMLQKFNGMWAFAIYDNIEKTLFLSRDRFGVKPLYYFYDKQTFYFSSEVQAIHKLLGKSHPLNEYVINDISNGGFLSHGTDQTYLQNVFALPGGYQLVIKNAQLKVDEWYSLKKVPVPSSFKKQALALKELLNDACILRMRSDVPVGTCLSGGLDSGSITSVIANYEPGKGTRFDHYSHKAFCASFPNTPIDESKDAMRLATQLKSDLQIIEVKAPSEVELIQAMNYCDGPMHALAFYPIWKLYKYIKENKITVTLDGQGPDEMLGGYRCVKEAMQAAIELRKPVWLRDVYKTYAALGETDQISSKAEARKEWKLMLKKQSVFVKGRFKSILKRALFVKSVAQTTESGLYVTKLEPVRFMKEKQNALDTSLFKQFFQVPLPGILQQYDRCSMANGVECRMPFMDYRIVEFIFSLPVESKVGKGYTKRVLREAMKGILPDETRLNTFKIGFNAPIVDWFRGELKSFMLEQMNSETFLNSTHFDGIELKKSFEQFLDKPNPGWNEAWRFWPPVHLTWWLKNNTDFN